MCCGVCIQDRTHNVDQHSTGIAVGPFSSNGAKVGTGMHNASGRGLEIGCVEGLPTMILAVVTVLRATRAIQRSCDDLGEVITADVAGVDRFTTRAASPDLDSSLSVVVLGGVVARARDSVVDSAVYGVISKDSTLTNILRMNLLRGGVKVRAGRAGGGMGDGAALTRAA